METITLGKTGLKVSKLGFGGIPIQRVSEEEAIAVVQRCLDLGINFIDTANGYTTSEERIGKAIKGRRDGLVIATKSSARNPKDLESHIKLSLEHLGIDYIDIYQFHNVSSEETLETVLDPNGLMAVAQEAKAAGTIRHIGFSSHQIDTAKKAVESDMFETALFPFNFVASEPAEELLALTRKHNVGFIAMKPLAGGMLDKVHLAFKYLMQFPDILPVPGIQKLEEIEEIIQIVEGPRQMTEAERAEMQRVKEELGDKFCRRCDYCQPCPEGIPISMVIDRGLFKTIPGYQIYAEGGRFGGMMDTVANCQKCGDCEGRCPYNLPIREMIEENLNTFLEGKRQFQESFSSR